MMTLLNLVVKDYYPIEDHRTIGEGNLLYNQVTIEIRAL